MWIFFPLNIKICTHDILYVVFPACWSSHADAVIAEIWRLFSSLISLCLHLLWKMLGTAASVLFDVNLGSVGLSLLACFLIEINCVLHTAAINIRSSYYHVETLLAVMCVNVEIASKAFAKSDSFILSMVICLSLCLHVSQQFPLDGFSWHFIFGVFTKFYWHSDFD